MRWEEGEEVVEVVHLLPLAGSRIIVEDGISVGKF